MKRFSMFMMIFAVVPFHLAAMSPEKAQYVLDGHSDEVHVLCERSSRLNLKISVPTESVTPPPSVKIMLKNRNDFNATAKPEGHDDDDESDPQSLLDPVKPRKNVKSFKQD